MTGFLWVVLKAAALGPKGRRGAGDCSGWDAGQGPPCDRGYALVVTPSAMIILYSNRSTVFSGLPVRRRQLLSVAAVAGLSLAPLAMATAPIPFTLPVAQAQATAPKELLLVTYAVTKAAYDQIIPLFVADWKKKTGQTVSIRTSYGGSGSQTRAVIDGLEADVVGLAMAADITKIQQAGLINPGWERQFPNNAVATNSTVVAFLRPGNPKKIKSWQDLDNKNVDKIGRAHV